MKVLKLFILLIISASTIYSGQWEEKQKNLINELYKGQFYHGAIGEIRRLILFNPQYEKDGLYSIALCYFRGKQFNRVIYTLKNTSNRGFAVNLLAGYSLINKNDFSTALLSLRKYKYSSILSPKYREDLLMFRLHAFMNQGDFITAQKELVTALDFIAYTPQYSLLQKDLQLLSDRSLPRGDIAALLSALMPGLGHFYSGKIWHGIISLLAVAGAVIGAVLTFEKHREISVSLMTLSVVFYGASIYSAYNSALDERQKTIRRGIMDMRKRFKENYNPEKYSQLIDQ